METVQQYLRSLAEESPAAATNKTLKREPVRAGTDFDDPCRIREERGRRQEVRR